MVGKFERVVGRMVGRLIAAVLHFVRLMALSLFIWNVAWAVPLLLAPHIDKLVRGTSAIAVYSASGHTWAFYLVWYVITFAASVYIGRIAKTGGWFYAGFWALFTPFASAKYLGLEPNWALLVNVLFMTVSALGGFAGQRILQPRTARKSLATSAAKQIAAR